MTRGPRHVVQTTKANNAVEARRDARGSDDLPLEPYCNAEYASCAVTLRRTAALLGRFLPRLGPLAQLAALFIVNML
jgi:hypothetical protein